MEYRLNFFLATISSIINTLGSVFALNVIYRVGKTLGEWSFDEALLVLGIFITIEGFSQSFLIPNLNSIVNYIWKGTLDFVLLKPISSQFYLSARNLSIWGFPSIFLGFGIMTFSVLRLNTNLVDVSLGFLSLIASIVILYSIWFVLGSMSIWFVKIYNLTFVLKELLEAGKFPTTAYPDVYRFFFTFVIPITFLTTIPASLITGKGKLVFLPIALVLSVVFFAFSRAFWSLARKHYSSASS